MNCELVENANYSLDCCKLHIALTKEVLFESRNRTRIRVFPQIIGQSK